MIKNNCPHAGKCGGCQLPNLEYGQQLAFKQAAVIKQIGRFCRKTRRIKHFCGKATTNPSLPWTKAVS